MLPGYCEFCKQMNKTNVLDSSTLDAQRRLVRLLLPNTVFWLPHPALKRGRNGADSSVDVIIWTWVCTVYMCGGQLSYMCIHPNLKLHIWESGLYFHMPASTVHRPGRGLTKCAMVKWCKIHFNLPSKALKIVEHILPSWKSPLV